MPPTSPSPEQPPAGPHEEPPGPPWRPPWARAGARGRPPGLAVAAAVAVVQVVGSTLAGRNQGGRVSLDAFGYVLLLLGPALLVLRGRWPLAVVAGTSVVTATYLAAGYPYGPVFVSWLIACCAAIGGGHRRAAWAGLAGVYLVHVLVTFVLPRSWQRTPPSTFSWQQELGLLAWLLLVMAVAEIVRFRRERIAAHRAYRQQLAQRRADEERLKMARELHDILAHSLSLINIQAGVALALLDRRPEEARTALTTIKSTSKEALGEVRQVLATLRGPGAAPRTPAPGLDRLDELTAQADRVGLAVEMHERGERRPLTAAVDLTAFRIVQEALTNVIRHSVARQAVVVLDWTVPGVLVVRVEDPGPAVLGDAGGTGSGLAGMRERVAAFGGTISAGPLPGGGFRVRAELPTPKAEGE
ncbi:sensor histidine kinase [Streptomyces kaniharaensis]|uniref:histidine kinase n=2 Tax=Streptomyces kaniharaensis TaxID=212423 RepID=A0A6N7KPL6_9ACTN|nr:sensor histidine kinase [Streptomyces kaniharaensis]